MYIKQISVFLENRCGRLAEATKILKEYNINISAMSIAETTDYGVLRLIVNKPNEACQALRHNGFTVKETDIIAIMIDDAPGGLYAILNTLEKASVSVEYIYAFAGKRCDEDKALTAFKVEDNDKAIAALQKAGITVAKTQEIYNI
ncbi:MAG: ACT domain-containing protein [Chloroflexi bacterium]|nr:ACT domain-containing protein [Chloroflexota bacterium]